LRLRGTDLALLAETAADLVLAAKLNKFFPDPFGCSNLLRMLGDPNRAGVLSSWIDQGWADEGYGSLVQREMEDSIMPKVEKALDDLQKELKSTVRDLLRKSR